MNMHQTDHYLFHQGDMPDVCFCCARRDLRLIIVRHQSTNRLVHLCVECMEANGDEYLLDNTRPWTGAKL